VTQTASPTVIPSISPTLNPSEAPTVTPSSSPTLNPSEAPTVTPSSSPTVTPSTHPTSNPTKTKTSSKRLSGGAIAGIAIGAVLFVCIIVAIVMYLKRRAASDQSATSSATVHPVDIELFQATD